MNNPVNTAGRDAPLWISRGLVALVFFFNVQCAVEFLANPGAYVPAYGLDGMAGEAAVRGMGILFLMWNVPYAVALWHPLKHLVSLWEAVAMQAVGLAGESLLLGTLTAASAELQSGIWRFIFFDGAGLILLSAALALMMGMRRRLAPGKGFTDR